MTLHSYLKQFKNIAWYPSAGKDMRAIVCLCHKSLKDYGLSKEEAPDCFIYTNYETFADQAENHRFFLDVDENEDKDSIDLSSSNFTAALFNAKELNRLPLSFAQNLVDFNTDEYYGRVFVADVLIEHPGIGKIITKLIYVIAENTAFAFEFLLKKNIKVKYAIHSCYGHGFGGGRSNGAFMCNILKDLGTRYFASDMNDCYDHDVADEYLTGIQTHTLPVLKEIDNFSLKYGWHGYGDTMFHEVVGFDKVGNGMLENKRFIIYTGREKYDHEN